MQEPLQINFARSGRIGPKQGEGTLVSTSTSRQYQYNFLGVEMHCFRHRRFSFLLSCGPQSNMYCLKVFESTRGLLKSAGLIITRSSMLWVRAPLRAACLYLWARYLISIASLTRAYLGLVVCVK